MSEKLTKKEKGFAQIILDNHYRKYEKYPTREQIKKLGEILNKKIDIKTKDLYIIQCAETNRVKIGISDNPKARLLNLESQSPYQLKILKVVEYGGVELERHLHSKFIKDRHHGEWFIFSNEIKDFVNDIIKL